MSENKIQKRKSNLPVKLEDLAKWILIGKQALVSKIAKYKAIKTAKGSYEAKQQILGDTQDFAEELLYAETYLGERLNKRDRSYQSSGRGTLKEKPLPEGIDKKQSHYAQELNRHIDLIAKVIEKARETDEIPLRHHVLREIQKTKPKPDTPELPEDIYNVIYADPPWQYDNAGLGGAASKHYETKPIEEIRNLKDKKGRTIQDCCAENSVLFLWTTNPFLEDAFEVLREWGFEYKTNFCWTKEGRATYGKLGFYVRGQHELLLIAIKGSMLPQGELPESIIKTKKSKHSTKPIVVYSIIEKMYPKGKYLELFARKKHSEKWTVWGLEV